MQYRKAYPSQTEWLRINGWRKNENYLTQTAISAETELADSWNVTHYSPTILSAMQKASAFITDEGGVTCHAAIVARELKKPCIIGTKIATKVLKDGDLVEVDTEKGVVKILKNS